MPHQDQINQATIYIKNSRKRIEELERRKRELTLMKRGAVNNGVNNATNMDLPILEIKDLGSEFEVILISGPNKNFMLHQIIRIMEDGGAQVVSLNFATIHNKTFHTFHAQVTIISNQLYFDT